MAASARTDLSPSVGLLITIVAIVATAAAALTAHSTLAIAQAEPAAFTCFLLLTIALQLFSIEGFGGGTIGVSGIGMLATGFVLGPGAAVAVGLASGVVNLAVRRGVLHRAIFDAGQWALAAGAGALVYHLVTLLDDGVAGRLAGAGAAGIAYSAINNTLLCLAIGLSTETPPTAVWRERFRWARVHYLSFGPLALGCALAYEQIGVVGLIAFALPPGLVLFSVRQYLDRTRAAVEEVRAANAELAARNEDLHELFEFAGGLAARAHDQEALVRYAERTLSRLRGAQARLTVGEVAGGERLYAGGTYVGALLADGPAEGDHARWDRLRETLLPQLATALESSTLVQQLRDTHREVIAALSRSMEAKDYYTGGHTERVAEVAVAIGRRLGFSGADLDAIEIGALLHDIGKIGIPERILHKQAPLDEEEWRVMKEHPVISDRILSEVKLHPIVRQIARWSHERIDGTGYPDGLAGDDIPLPARIALVADAFDALTSDRPYRRGRHPRAAIDELRAGVGTQFCPRVIEALERVYAEEPELLGDRGLRAVAVA